MPHNYLCSSNEDCALEPAHSHDPVGEGELAENNGRDLNVRDCGLEPADRQDPVGEGERAENNGRDPASDDCGLEPADRHDPDGKGERAENNGRDILVTKPRRRKQHPASLAITPRNYHILPEIHRIRRYGDAP